MNYFTTPSVRRNIKRNYPIEDHDLIDWCIDFMDADENMTNTPLADRVCRAGFLKNYLQLLKKVQHENRD